jgi:hypothetical protein
MSASSALLTDVTTVITNGPSATTKANSIAAAGPINDYVGNTKGLLLKLQEASVLAKLLVTDTDSSGDSTNLALINGVVAALNGTGSPSTTLIADMKTVIASGPQGTTNAKAIAAAGPIMDYVGNSTGVLLKLQEANVLATMLGTVTASGDDSTNKTLLANVLLALA